MFGKGAEEDYLKIAGGKKDGLRTSQVSLSFRNLQVNTYMEENCNRL